MNKEQEELLSDAYQNYRKIEFERIISQKHGEYLIGKEEFIEKIKTDIKFAKRWGVVYGERELSYVEREKLFNENYESLDKEGLNQLSALIATDNITPKRIISITYNNETIESYE